MLREEGTFPINLMARLLGVAGSGYYRWRKARAENPEGTPSPGSRAERRMLLEGRIAYHHGASGGAHGIRRIQADLAAEGITASLSLIGSIMRDLGIQGAMPRTRVRTTVPAADVPNRKDLVRRRFRPAVPTTYLCGDITYLKTGEGFCYLATVIDMATRMVIGWAIADHMRVSLVIEALRRAHATGYVAGGAIFQSDRGSVYTSAEYARVAGLLDVRLSVGRTGVCWDNAVAESFFASLKKEMYDQQKFATMARANLAVADYIEIFYNYKRRHSTLGYQTPVEVMNAFFDRTATATTVAA